VVPSTSDARQGLSQRLRSHGAAVGAGALAIAAMIGVGIVLLAPAAVPQAMQVTGYAGHLGEWELTATLAKTAAAGRELSGPLTMTHIGLCTQDGPQQRTGEMRVRLARLTSRIDASVLIDGIECAYSASLSDAHTGTMVCPDRRPVPLTLWAR
jgi:hypothetical protein